ncbi:MAG: hypothetical protein HY718_10610 [Planctomycetes bacterium]|nr:hypothetical protein [Planctomycetota bacterium]
MSGLSRRWWMAAAMAGLAAVSCVPKRVHWSPDGQQAIVLAGENVFVTDADGKLSGPFPAALEQVSWRPDSRGFVAVRQEELSTWEQVARVLSPEQDSRLMELEEPFRKEVFAHEGSWDGWRPEMAKELSAPELLALWIYAREHDAEKLRDKLGDHWKEAAKWKLTVRCIQLGEVEAGQMKLGPVLERHLDEIGPGSLLVSPDGQRAAYAVKDVGGPAEAKGGSDIGGSLRVRDLAEGAELRLAAKFAAWRFGWTADGRYLVYATTKTGPAVDGLVLGEIKRLEVADKRGKIREPAFPEADSLAGILYFPDTKIVCLKDGRILFSAAPVQLPASTNDMPQGVSLFAIDPERQATVTPLITREAQAHQPDDGFGKGLFEVRPGGTDVTMLNIEQGTVGVYTLATGGLDIIMDSKPEDKKALAEVPSWRTGDELSLVVPPGHEWGSAKRAELVLYSLREKKGRCISQKWPDELMNLWGENKPKPAPTQPE